MRVPQGLEFIENCLPCPHREEVIFRNLPLPAVQHLSAITSGSSYPKGQILFVEGQSPRGVFVVCKGRVKLSTSWTNGKTLILRICDADEVLGLAETVSGKPYNTTAEVLEPAEANFIGRADFLNFLREHAEAALRVAEQLSEDYRAVLSEMWTIGLSHPAGEKLTRFLMDLTAGHHEEGAEIRAELTLTHEEIAQMIGASPEMVTRLQRDFEEKQLIQIKGSTLVIRNKAALEHLESF